jgi:hypothetical protein
MMQRDEKSCGGEAEWGASEGWPLACLLEAGATKRRTAEGKTREGLASLKNGHYTNRESGGQSGDS